jgi:hypothetical protein
MRDAMLCCTPYRRSYRHPQLSGAAREGEILNRVARDNFTPHCTPYRRSYRHPQLSGAAREGEIVNRDERDNFTPHCECTPYRRSFRHSQLSEPKSQEAKPRV